MKRILPIVEGDGDMQAVPELIRRVAYEKGYFDLTICRPHKRGDFPKVRSRFDDFFRTALLEGCPILWVMDYDCAECVDEAADVEELRSRAQGLAQGMQFDFAFMVQEFETLFLADHETTRQIFPDISIDTAFPIDPELVRGAKEWISSARPKGSTYKPTQHQQRLSSQVNLGRLRARSPSFVRFENAVEGLLTCQA
jgi:Domain of unknown function (DUF4276)